MQNAVWHICVDCISVRGEIEKEPFVLLLHKRASSVVHLLLSYTVFHPASWCLLLQQSLGSKIGAVVLFCLLSQAAPGMSLG